MVLQPWNSFFVNSNPWPLHITFNKSEIDSLSTYREQLPGATHHRGRCQEKNNWEVNLYSWNLHQHQNSSTLPLQTSRVRFSQSWAFDSHSYLCCDAIICDDTHIYIYIDIYAGILPQAVEWRCWTKLHLLNGENRGMHKLLIIVFLGIKSEYLALFGTCIAYFIILAASLAGLVLCMFLVYFLWL